MSNKINDVSFKISEQFRVYVSGSNEGTSLMITLSDSEGSKMIAERMSVENWGKFKEQINVMDGEIQRRLYVYEGEMVDGGATVPKGREVKIPPPPPPRGPN